MVAPCVRPSPVNTTADNGGSRKFYYGAAGHQQWISQCRIIEIKHNAVGNMVTKQTHAESHQFGYDALNRLISGNRTQGTVWQPNGFAYDPNDNRLAETRNNVTTTFRYTRGSNRL